MESRDIITTIMPVHLNHLIILLLCAHNLDLQCIQAREQNFFSDFELIESKVV